MKPLTPALEQALDDLAESESTSLAVTLVQRAYRALPAVTGPWKAMRGERGTPDDWWVERQVGSDLGFNELRLSVDEATAQRYALALNIAEMTK